MAEIAPIETLRYNSEIAGPLGSLISPPYDVIDADMREKLVAGSAHNVVEIDLPETAAGEDKYAHSAELIKRWSDEQVLLKESESAYWILRQDYVGPDGAAGTRSGLFCRVRIEDYGEGRIRPHERTHPGPKQDRLDLMRATNANLSPIFSLFSDRSGEFSKAIEAVTGGAQPFDSCDDNTGTKNLLWRVGDASTIANLTANLAGKELLIADGHHRYETARTYAAEVGGEGAHNFVLMFLCALEDPGMTVFATHRLVKAASREQRAAIREAIDKSFDVSEIGADDLAPADSDDTSICEFGYIDRFHGKPLRLSLKDQSIAETALADKPSVYRELDTAILEALFLKGALGMSDDDISHLNGLWYSSDAEEARSLIESGQFDAAFFLRPTPIDQIRAIAAAGESMPPKSTYFYPKVPTGLVFNPLT